MAKTKNGGPCWASHPVLTFTDKETGEEIGIRGGNYMAPPDGTDIHVPLQSGYPREDERFPWDPAPEAKEHEMQVIRYTIPDMQPPKDPVSFAKMILWLADNLRHGLNVHVACIGGHGRTGTVLAALVATMTDIEDPIKYVRENYCSHAVETKGQVDFLVKFYGCKEVKGTKEGINSGWSGGKSWKGKSSASNGGSSRLFTPLDESPMSIWGEVRKIQKSLFGG